MPPVSSFNSKSPRKGRHVGKPKPTKPKLGKLDKGKGKGKLVCLGNKIPIAGDFDLDNPSSDGYSLAMDSVSNVFSHNREFNGLADALVYERIMYDGQYVFALLDRKEVKLLALITSESGETVVVLADKEEFVDVEKFLKEDEGLEEAVFLYFTSPAKYSIEHVTFGVDLIRNDMTVLFEMNAKSVKVFENVISFVRIFCFFVVPAILPEWRDVFSEIMEPLLVNDEGKFEYDVTQLDEYMINIWMNWGNVSDFVNSGGVTVLPKELDFLDLALAKSQLSVLKSPEMIAPIPLTNIKKDRGYHSIAGPSSTLSGPSLLLGADILHAPSGILRSFARSSQYASDFLPLHVPLPPLRVPAAGTVHPRVPRVPAADTTLRAPTVDLKLLVKTLSLQISKIPRFFKKIPK